MNMEDKNSNLGLHSESFGFGDMRPSTEDDLPEEEMPEEESQLAEAQTETEEEPEEDSLPRWMQISVYLVAVLAASFLISFAAWKCAVDVFGFGKPDEEVSIVIQNGDSMSDVIDMLSEQEVIQYKWLFRLFCGFTHAEKKISTGTYTVNKMYDYNAIVSSMTAYSKTRVVVNVTVPEGYTCGGIFRLLENNGVCTVEELEQAAASVNFDYDFLDGVPYGQSNRLEGYLFPDTYQFYVGDSAERVLNKFLSNFENKMSGDFMEDLEELNETLAEKMRTSGFSEAEIEENRLTLRDLVIVASIIQEESYGVSESSSIASVIYNRLTSRAYPLLEMDSTLRYALEKWSGDLTDADYRTDSGYNTHRNTGLPDGPISNPGIESFRAALYPRDSGYLFFGYDEDTGMHFFANTYYEYESFLEESDDEKAS